MKRAIALIVIALSLVACEGKQGPAGPAGPGERIVYSSTTSIPTEDLYTVNVPEITMDDMPLVSVYVSNARTGGLWMELPLYTEAGPDNGTVCYLDEGEVIFQECFGFYYKIVIVK